MFQPGARKWIVVLAHVAFWLIIFSFPFLLHPELYASTSSDRSNFAYFVGRFAAWIGFFYLNVFVLVPKLIYQRKYLQYFLVQAGIVALLCASHILYVNYFFSHFHMHSAPIWFTILPYIFIWACSTAYQMFRNKIAMDKLVGEKERENLKTELSFLRSQVSPHFMFNVLNNMVSLARKNSDQLEPSLIKLSGLLRYMVYETDEAKKPLEKEIEYLQSYIDLQQQRFGKNIQINSNLQRNDINYTVEPMLLIPFVENAFKHGVVWEEGASIDIDLKVKEGQLHFFVRNRFNPSASVSRDDTPGIGLANVKRRLELLYPGRHFLQIANAGGWFSVSLQLNLN